MDPEISSNRLFKQSWANRSPHCLVDMKTYRRFYNAIAGRAWFFWLLIIFYLCSYFVLTIKGSYMPLVVGMDGVKTWSWEPLGFRDAKGKRHLGLCVFYIPLYWLDTRIWHTDNDGLDGPRYEP